MTCLTVAHHLHRVWLPPDSGRCRRHAAGAIPRGTLALQCKDSGSLVWQRDFWTRNDLTLILECELKIVARWHITLPGVRGMLL